MPTSPRESRFTRFHYFSAIHKVRAGPRRHTPHIWLTIINVIYRKFLRYFLGLVSTLMFIASIAILIGNASIKKLPESNPTNSLRIVSMNILANNVLTEKLQRQLINSNPNIIVMLEWSGNNLVLTEFTSQGFRVVLNEPTRGVHGICMLSKLNGSASIIEAPIKTPCPIPIGQLRFEWQNSSISLFAIHAPPPIAACEATTGKYLNAVSKWFESGNLTTDIGAGKKGDQLILVGDFNSISLHQNIKRMKSKGLNDAHCDFCVTDQTWRPSSSFPYLVKIDYILTSGSLKSINAQRFRISKSDHLGLLADLQIAD